MKKILLIIPVISIWHFGCQKELSKEGSNTNTSTQVDVYVGGIDSATHASLFELALGIAVYWKNGKPVNLTQRTYDDGPDAAAATSIAVSGADVYVTGYQNSCGPYRCSNRGRFWKNGILVDEYLFLDFYYLTSLAVSNNDVYVVGPSAYLMGRGETAIYVKNENQIDLPNGSAGSIATAIAVSGTNVYVAGIGITGNVYNGPQNHIATYWKNGRAINLTDGSNGAQAWSIAVSGTDVYVAGREFNGNPYYDGFVGQTRPSGIAKYWKNSSAINLTDGSADATATSIAVSGADVYVAGTEWNGNSYQIQGSTYVYRKSVAKYWKNGKVVNLTDGAEDAVAKSIAISGTDVYVAGTVNGYATYWKNGVAVKLSNVESEANSIFLVKK